MGQGASRCDAALPPIGGAPELPKSPGQFERLHEDTKRLTNINTFEGARFEVSKPLTPMFALTHTFMLGASPYPSANSHYKLGANVGDNDRVVISSIDQHGTVEGQCFGNILPFLQGKLIFNLPHDPKGFVAVCDADFSGRTSSAQLKLAQNIHGQPGTHLGVSYVQAITPRLSLGGEGHCSLGAPSATLVAAGKYAASKFSSVVTYTRAGPNEQLAIQYHRTVSPGRVQLGSELALQPATGEAQMAAGAEFSLKQSRINLSVDGTGKMQSIVETTLSPAAKLTFSAEMHLGVGGGDEPGKPRDSYKFGYALQIGQ
ncbi:hypothetical protein CTAYLR_000202 [Chrysophaeum taylorii]|uniref:Uncharacterized protein n=1 Tax=Chrysophaeum taylorii TaxID=2483200 RepID=A0AAD7UEF9_9STRA|nr:hypothetical protein CTAYLR_000202 [Chrysophaeum taylorii]